MKKRMCHSTSVPQVKRAPLDSYPIIIVGSGLFGLTIAQLVASKLNKRVLIIEKRNHPGGNSWSETDPTTGIEFHTYGSHLFHTNNLRVWNFVNQFTEFTNYRHRVLAKHNDAFFNIPINLQTMSQFFGKAFSPNQARLYFEELPNKSEGLPRNFAEAAISSIGHPLYAAFFESYTKKQWQTDPRSLPAETFKRIPIRFTFNSDYFDDTYQGLPKHGYSQLINRMLQNPNIDYLLNTDFFEFNRYDLQGKLIIYTGPIDRYYDYQHGVLGWRTLDFRREIVDVSDFQGNAVVNYPDLDVEFTRIHEFRHLHPERKYEPNKTLIMREYSRFAGKSDEPYYPINTTEDRLKLKLYREKAKREKNVIFGGRLGSYQYLDMHMAIASAFTTFENEVCPLLINLESLGDSHA